MRRQTRFNVRENDLFDSLIYLAEQMAVFASAGGAIQSSKYVVPLNPQMRRQRFSMNQPLLAPYETPAFSNEHGLGADSRSVFDPLLGYSGQHRLTL